MTAVTPPFSSPASFASATNAPVAGTPSVPNTVPQNADDAQLRDVAQQFEALFLRQMLSAARSSPFGEDRLFGSAGEDSFTEMRDAEFADIASKSGTLGFAATIEKQLRSRIGPPAHSAAYDPSSAAPADQGLSLTPPQRAPLPLAQKGHR